MVARIVVGANYGDEGKGTVVAHYTKHAKGSVLNVLTNGGPQRAHSILTEDGSFTFQHFGSGTYHGADTYFSCFFIVNPFAFVEEYKRLTDDGRVKISKIYRDPRCRWTTPWDMMANQIKEELRRGNKHGSCGMGIWETVLRYSRTLTISFDEFMLMDDARQRAWLREIRDYHTRNLDIPDSWKEIFLSDNIVSNFIADCKIFDELTTTLSLDDCKGYSEMIFENGQGLLLTDTGKDVAGTTPSRTGCEYAMSLLQNKDCEISTHYVTRTYLTRHGNGFLDKETSRQNISSFIEDDRTNHFNEFQGSFRYSPLDIDSLAERIRQDAVVNPIIEVTHCDEVDNISEFQKRFNKIVTYDSPLIW